MIERIIRVGFVLMFILGVAGIATVDFPVLNSFLGIMVLVLAVIMISVLIVDIWHGSAP